ncbi:TATA-binding protein-associated factor BTAF1 [Frankliniella fusca]|uniref:TATA-binding protein-associated factor BTAF1 n=1 Tax=Frankliniella fusca TaxID=407009 RepID=A0AAE1H866_9NEOP|nr:TATA-binding protein-associated factor BTAF1 [Frankliniella fusca]
MADRDNKALLLLTGFMLWNQITGNNNIHAQKLQHKKTQNMQYLLKLCVETKYIVSPKIAVPDGISNGSPCILKKVIYGQLCEKTAENAYP